MTDGRDKPGDFTGWQARIKDQRERARERDLIRRVPGLEAQISRVTDGVRDGGIDFGSSSIGMVDKGLDDLIHFTQLFPPQTVIENLDDHVPFALLPVRIETRFRTVGGVAQLWVRIFPDTVHVSNFDEVLDDAEVKAAEAFWTEIWRSGGDANRELGAWRVLTAASNPRRAVWIAKSHAPANEKDSSGASNRPAAPLADDAPLPVAPQFPAVPAHPQSWTRPAHAMAMPDQFVAIGFVGGAKLFEQVGAAIPSPLIVGPDPLADDDALGPLDAELKWLADFDEAVAVGMGMRILLPAAAAAGLDRLVVLGIRASATAADGAGILEEVIRSHSYSGGGFGILAQGTPTNNTRQAGSGLSSVEENDAERYDREFRRPPRTLHTDWRERSDGEYLAEALGIAPDLLLRAENGDGFDRRDARAANVATWPATLGAFLTEMMDPVLDLETIDRVRHFYTEHVSGRGPVSAIRTGKQPYGVLVASAPSRWVYPAGRVRPSDGQVEFVQGPPLDTEAAFLEQLHTVLMTLDQTWATLADEVAYVGKPGDAQAHLLEVLGLQPRSVRFHQRFVASLDQMQNMLILGNQETLAETLTARMKQESDVALDALGIDSNAFPAIYQRIFFNEAPAFPGPFVEGLPASETRPLAPVSEDHRNYLQWLAYSDFDTIRREDFGYDSASAAIPAPNALAYLVLRQAAMNAYWMTAANFYSSAGLAHLAPRSDSPFINLGQGPPRPSRIRALYSPAGPLTETFADVFPDSNASVAQQMTVTNLQGLVQADRLLEFQGAVELLADRPTAALGRVIAESIDTCSFRLDSWLIALASHRLGQLRAAGNAGVHVGAFGYLETLKPGPALQPFAGPVPVAFASATGPNLSTVAANGGYIHAPSLSHAVTAAILRSGYLTHNSGPNPPLQINLSSDRVRRAAFILEGMRNGQSLGALLGYQFEASVHDAHGLAEIDSFIFDLRAKFPLVAGQITSPPSGTAIQSLEARNVVDGLKLVRHVQTTSNRTYPYGFTDLHQPPATAAQAGALDIEIARLEETLDAVADVMMSESVYGAVRGNFERAGAALDSISGGNTHADPEIVRPPRGGFALTHRLCLHLPPHSDYGHFNPYAGTIPLTPRASLEPALNAWLATIFGDLGDIVCAFDLATDDLTGTGTVSLARLGLQPIDLLYILEPRSAAAEGELDSRIVYAVRKLEELPSRVKVTINYLRPAEGKLTIFEILPLVRALKALCLGTRALGGGDLTPASLRDDSPPAAGQVHNPNGWDLDALRARVSSALEAARSLRDSLNMAVASPSADILRALLETAAGYGITSAVPACAVGGDEAETTILAGQAKAVAAALEARIDAAAVLFSASAASLDGDQRAARLASVARALFGPDFLLVPTFAFAAARDVEFAFRDRTSILRHVVTRDRFPLETWLAGMARVRDKPANLERILVLTEALGLGEPAFAALQLPYRELDYWLGMDFPPECTPDGDRLLLMSILGGPLDSNAQAGLLLDEFIDTVPAADQTTGLAFNFDVPNAQPVQALLLAVTPEVTGQWKWDDLVATVIETMDLAKKRAVEPHHLDQSIYAQLLPAILLPVTHGPPSMGTDWSTRVELEAVRNTPKFS